MTSRGRSVFAFGLLVQLSFAVPHIPQVVFPSKDYARPSADGISRGKTTTKNAGSTTTVRNNSPVQLAFQQDAPIVTESRVVLAPIDGKPVYTLDRYVITSSERVEPKHPPRPRAALAATTQLGQRKPPLRPHGTPAISPRGISAVNEVVAVGDLTRTTMAERSGAADRLASPLASNSTTAAPTTSGGVAPKNKNPLGSLRNVRLVSHDTSRASAEVRYPAKDWQLPPQLLSARTKSRAVDTNTLKAGEYPSLEEVDGSYEEALDLYTKTQLGSRPPTRKIPPLSDPPRRNLSAPLHYSRPSAAGGPQGPPPTLQGVVKSIDAMIEKAFGEKKPRPKMTYVPGDPKKFRATFASHRGDKQVIPLPGAPFADDTDMDLLVENTRRPGARGPVSSGQKSLGRPVPLQAPAAAYVPLDPNYKLDLCCRKQQVSTVCQNMCNFDTFTDRSLVNAVLSNQCPGPQLGHAFDCASSKADHTDCCTRNNLHLYAGGQCMTFCRTHQPTPPNLISYLACLQVFDTVKNCYREYSYAHANIFGD